MIAIYYDKSSIDSIAGAHLICEKYKDVNPSLYSINALDGCVLDNEDVFFIIGHPKVSAKRMSEILNTMDKVFWFSADYNSIKLLEENSKLISEKTIVMQQKNVGTSLLVYMNQIKGLKHSNDDEAIIRRNIRKAFEYAPEWLVYLNKTDGTNNGEFMQLALEDMIIKDGLAPDSSIFNELNIDLNGTAAVAKLAQMIQYGQSLKIEALRQAQKELLEAQKGKQTNYKAPDSWNN